MILTSSEQFFDLAEKSEYIAVDTEGDGKDVRDPGSGASTMGVSLAFRGPDGSIHADYFPFHHKIGKNEPENFEYVKKVIEGHECKIFHFAPHDIDALDILGIDVHGHLYYDTMCLAHWVNENLHNYGLDSVSKYYGGSGKKKSKRLDQIIDLFGWGSVPVAEHKLYAAHDAVITLEIFERTFPTFRAEGYDGKLWSDMRDWLEFAYIPMARTGILVDKEFCQKELDRGLKIMREIEESLGGRKPSGKNLQTIIFDELGLPVEVRTPKGKPSLNKEAMSKYAISLATSKDTTAQKVIRYRGWQKVTATNYMPYINMASESDGRLRPHYKYAKTKTSRLSSGADSDGSTEVKSPNMQNIPKTSDKEWDGKLKQAFIPREGFSLISFDQSNLELRITAAYSQDPVLVDTFINGRNVFDDMSINLTWHRDACKTFVYATGYNAQDERISQYFGISVEQAAYMRKQFHDTYQGVEEFKKKGLKDLAKVKYKYIKLWTGRRRHFLSRREAQHLWFNSLNQGGAAELIKYNMIACGRKIDWETCFMLLQIHDELVFEIRDDLVPEWSAIITECMENVPEPLGSRIPFKVESKVWGSK